MTTDRSTTELWGAVGPFSARLSGVVPDAAPIIGSGDCAAEVSICPTIDPSHDDVKYELLCPDGQAYGGGPMATSDNKDRAQGKRLRALRLARDLTQREVAEAVGVPRSHYGMWEGGMRPERAGLEALAKFFGVKPDAIGQPYDSDSNRRKRKPRDVVDPTLIQVKDTPHAAGVGYPPSGSLRPPSIGGVDMDYPEHEKLQRFLGLWLAMDAEGREACFQTAVNAIQRPAIPLARTGRT